jgi:hypothetical protein
MQTAGVMMASRAVVPKLDESTAEAGQAGYVKKRYSSEYLAEQEAIEKRVREEGAKRIRRSVERLIALGIVDTDGNRLKKELPADMLPGADRDFGG